MVAFDGPLEGWDSHNASDDSALSVGKTSSVGRTRRILYRQGEVMGSTVFEAAWQEKRGSLEWKWQVPFM